MPTPPNSNVLVSSPNANGNAILPTLQLDSIHVGDRYRKDYGDLSDLIESIQRVGLIHPLVLARNADGTHNLVAGGRRIAALRELPVTRVYHGTTCDPLRPGYIYSDEMTEELRMEVELEENIRRKDTSWQERCLHVAKLHNVKKIRSAMDAKQWGYEKTGEMLGLSLGSINNLLCAARELQNPDSPLWQMDNLTESVKYFLRKQEDEATRLLAKMSVGNDTRRVDIPKPSTKLEDNLTLTDGDPQNPQPNDMFCLRGRVAELYAKLNNRDYVAFSATATTRNQLDQVSFFKQLQSLTEETPIILDDYLPDKEEQVIDLSSTLFNRNCLDFLRSCPPSTFDHCITDPPYGIDVDYMEQSGKGIGDIDRIRDTHQVVDNLQLFIEMFPLVFRALKDTGFFALWCDQENWHYMKNIAIEAGFRVQRWPITWCKGHQCLNQSAQYNYTKSTEIAMICRKPLATLATTSKNNWFVASLSNEEKAKYNHPFTKPELAWRFLFETIAIPGQHILEPFAGCGSGVIPMLTRGYEVTACELDPTHFSNLVLNVQDHYKQTFDKVKFV